jgi:putative hydrolase of the HAD superfamily
MNTNKQLIVFDLDDTLVDTSEIYFLARNRFLSIMQEEGFDPKYVIGIFESIDKINIEKHGYRPERYGKSMEETYDQLTKLSGNVVKHEVKCRVAECGMILFVKLPRVIDGAIELLEWSYQQFKLVLLTRGVETLQHKKIEHANLRKYFGLIRIENLKDKNSYLRIIYESGYLPEQTWVIGDSIKSDINPGIEAGAKCILYVYKHPDYYWAQEYGHFPVGSFYRIDKLNEAINILKNPLLFQQITSLE